MMTEVSSVGEFPCLLVYCWLQYKSFLLSCIKILLVLSERNPPLPLLAKFSPFRLLRAHEMEEQASGMSPSAGFTCSGEDGNHVFGECRRRHDYSLPFLFPALAASISVPGIGNFRSGPGGTTSSGRSSLQHFCTASSGTTTSTKHHVAFGCFRLCRWVR